MTKELHPGDRVEWRHSQGRSTGTVVRKLTATAQIKGHKVAAAPDNPEYLVESARTHARAVHKPSGLRKV